MCKSAVLTVSAAAELIADFIVLNPMDHIYTAFSFRFNDRKWTMSVSCLFYTVVEEIFRSFA